jgi:hypothetical protein
MTAAAAESLGIRRVSLARRMVVFLAVLALALQSYITQTHIHDAGFGGAGKITTTQSSIPGKTPVHDSQADCPFCQAMIHAGVFAAPAAPLLNLPITLVQTVALVLAPRAVSSAVTHDWQSRAPPRL